MTDIQLQIATLTQQLQECKLANHDFATKYAALKAEHAKLEEIHRRSIQDWAEVDDAFEAAGIVMHDDGGRKGHAEAIKELHARCERYRLRDLAEEEKFRTCLTSGLDEEQQVAEKRCAAACREAAAHVVPERYPELTDLVET